jgi:hypothetical protein
LGKLAPDPLRRVAPPVSPPVVLPTDCPLQAAEAIIKSDKQIENTTTLKLLFNIFPLYFFEK